MHRFESSVNSYGGKTIQRNSPSQFVFESSVNSYGGKTFGRNLPKSSMFESSVNSYSRKYPYISIHIAVGLRVV